VRCQAGALRVAALNRSGIYHWGVDNYGDGSTPVFGRQIAAFQGHHQRPWTITQREFANNMHQVGQGWAGPLGWEGGPRIRSWHLRVGTLDKGREGIAMASSKSAPTTVPFMRDLAPLPPILGGLKRPQRNREAVSEPSRRVCMLNE
jgi:hypothetical protein